MQTISIITAIAPEASSHFAETVESVRRQVVPAGWSIEWVICVDGPDAGPVSDAPAGIESVRVVTAGRRLGPGGCRNVAAVYSRGAILKNLDADDVLLDGALNSDIEALTGSADIGWTTSEALDLLPDGRRVSFTTETDDRDVPIGYLAKLWARQPILDVHPTTLAIRRELFWAAGGYAALPMSEDVAMLTRANMIAAGLHRVEATLLYRKWDGQMTSGPKPDAYDLIRATISAQLLSHPQGDQNRSFGK